MNTWSSGARLLTRRGGGLQRKNQLLLKARCPFTVSLRLRAEYKHKISTSYLSSLQVCLTFWNISAKSPVASTPFAWKLFFGRFLLRLSRIKRSQGMSMVKIGSRAPNFVFDIFIGPESDHWFCLSVTHSLTNSCLVNLIDATLSCKDANS